VPPLDKVDAEALQELNALAAATFAYYPGIACPEADDRREPQR